MFWSSIANGFEVLSYWETYVAGVIFILISIGPTVPIGLLAMKSGRFSGLAGCLPVLILPIFQVFAFFVFVVTLSPIILGLSNDAAWTLPWQLIFHFPWGIIKLIFVLLLATFLIAFVPLIGRLQSLHTLIMGSVALIMVLGILKAVNPVFPIENVRLWPGFWFTLGLLLVGAVLAWVGLMLAAFLSAPIEAAVAGLGQLILFPIGGIFGFIPVFIYGAWLGAQIHT